MSLKIQSWKAWVEGPQSLIKEGVLSQELKVICRVAKWEWRVITKRVNL